MLGRSPLGSYPLAALRAGVAVNTSPLSTGTVYVQDDNGLRSPEPFIHFYELTAAGGEVLRACDMFDPHLVDTDGMVEFDGEDWRPWPITRDTIESSVQDLSPSFSVTAIDPGRILLGFLNRNSQLRKATMRIWIIRKDLIGTPSAAILYRAQVRSTIITESPTTTISLQISGPQLRNKKYPARRFNRWSCSHDFGRKHVHYLAQNNCNWPSDEFGEQTQQFLKTISWAVHERLHGWRVMNGQGEDSVHGVQALYINGDLLFGFQGLYMNIFANGSDMTWWNGDRDGPYVFKDFDYTKGYDFDVATKIENVNTSTSNDVLAGILVQGTGANEGDHMMLAHRSVDPGPGAVYDMIWQQTINDVSSFTAINPTDIVQPTPSSHGNPTVLRMKRSGDQWTFYTRDEVNGENDEPENPNWDLHDTVTWDWQPEGDFRIGLVTACLDGNNPAVRFEWIRFYETPAGYTCDRSLRSCDQLNNLVDFVGMLALPEHSPASRF